MERLDATFDQAGKWMQLYKIAAERLDTIFNSAAPETLPAGNFATWERRPCLVAVLAQGAGLINEAERRMQTVKALDKTRFESGIDSDIQYASPTVIL